MELAATSGADPLCHQELLAWASLTGRRPAPWEVVLLLDLDARMRRILAPRRPAAPPAGDRSRGERPATPHRRPTLGGKRK